MADFVATGERRDVEARALRGLAGAPVLPGVVVRGVAVRVQGPVITVVVSRLTLVLWLVELFAHVHLARVTARPPDRERPQRLRLVEGDGALLEQLEQRQEPGDDDDGLVGVGHQVAEGRRCGRGGAGRRCRAACSRTLTWGTCRWSRPTVGGALGVSARAATMASCSGVIPMTSSGSSAANWGSSPAWRAVIRPAVAIRSANALAMSLNARYCSSRAKSRSRASMRAKSSSSVAARLRQQPGGLEVEQGGGDEEELGRLAEVPLGVGRLGAPDVRDELVGDRGQRDLGDVELVLGDQAEQQVERALEDVEVHLERGRPRPARQHPARGDHVTAGLNTGRGRSRPTPGHRAGVRPPHRGRSARGRAGGRRRRRRAATHTW